MVDPVAVSLPFVVLRVALLERRPALEAHDVPHIRRPSLRKSPAFGSYRTRAVDIRIDDEVLEFVTKRSGRSFMLSVPKIRA